jgi:hypothetical protein
MQINEARRDQLAAGVEDAERARCRDIGFERLDQPKADADVAPAAQRLARIEHVAASDDEIELVVRSHRGARRIGGGHCRNRRGSAEKPTARDDRAFHRVPPLDVRRAKEGSAD